jgi:hypothetical protein
MLLGWLRPIGFVVYVVVSVYESPVERKREISNDSHLAHFIEKV